MTYIEKMRKDHPEVDRNRIYDSCPGEYFENGPKPYYKCTGACISRCWSAEIPGTESTKKVEN